MLLAQLELIESKVLPALIKKQLQRCVESITIVERQKGIYEVQGKLLFQTQIIVCDKLEKPEHIWLCSLTNRIERREFDTLVDNIIRLREPYEKECADAVLEVVSSANRTNIEKWKEDVIMCEALAKIMEPEIQQAKDKAKKAGCTGI